MFPSQRFAIAAAFSLFFFFGTIFKSLLLGISDPHFIIPRPQPSHDQLAHTANITAEKLHAAYDAHFNITDFGRMGDLIAQFALLADTITRSSSSNTNKPLDPKPLLALLEKYFPWWQQPFPARTYTPFHRLTNTNTNTNTYTKSNTNQHPNPAETTGIVICAGTSQLSYATHLILSLRLVLNSTLPIQIAYAGPSDLPPEDRLTLTHLPGPEISTLNLLDYFDDAVAGLTEGGWAMKPFAALASPFQKTIVMDADAVFLQSPDGLFETEPGLRETGTLFWHDRAFLGRGSMEEGLRDGRHGWIRGILKGGRQPQHSAMLNGSLFWKEGAYQEMDSAAVCVDKGRAGVFMSLVFASWMNTKRVREEVTYTHVHGTYARAGDKETFWLASEISGSPYHFHPFYAGIIGVPKPLPTFKSGARRPAPPPATPLRSHPIHSIQPKHPREICSAQALHLDHRNRPLWFNGSLRKNKSLGKSLERLSRPFSPEIPMVQAGEEDRQNKTPHTEAEIQTLRQVLQMGEFTHWLPGGRNWTENGVWTIQASCLRGSGKLRVLDEELKENLVKTLQVAREADIRSFGLGG
ncbi:MAG: hypothetical protein Q9208_008031 [Pyrenodesmia sp. 3 TL-2023]